MESQNPAEALARTLDDQRLSRGEKRALGELLREAGVDTHDTDVLRSQAFGLARRRLDDSPAAGDVLEWLEDVVKLLRPAPPKPVAAARHKAFFSPGLSCVNAIRDVIGNARETLDVCVFSITDDRLAEEVIDAKRRRVRVRIVTDNDKSRDRGSDISRFERAGIPVAQDRTDNHMHHKFAVADRKRLLTGSYNWTRSAAERNEENIVVTDEPALVAAFVDQFERLWREFA